METIITNSSFASFLSAVIAGESPQILSRSLARSPLTASAYHMNYIILPLVLRAVCALQYGTICQVLHPQLRRNSGIE